MSFGLGLIAFIVGSAVVACCIAFIPSHPEMMGKAPDDHGQGGGHGH